MKKDRSWKKEEALREGKTINGARYFPNFIHAPIPTDMILCPVEYLHFGGVH
ncbi:MAG: hypothetical protein F6K48_09000 [Okeania sp. SIO3H1]|nr:hypothetical protein [Okeania sp. SIO3H1]